jgi:hypothetical protein
MKRKDIRQDTIPRILIHGLPDFEYDRARSTVAKQYGFRYYRVAGCVMSRRLLDSVIRENERTYKKLDARFGMNWGRLFDARVDTMYELQMEVEDLVRKEPHIVAKDQELGKEDDRLLFRIDPIGNGRQFTVWAYGWVKEDGEYVQIAYFKMNVDLNNGVISAISTSRERL